MYSHPPKNREEALIKGRGRKERCEKKEKEREIVRIGESKKEKNLQPFHSPQFFPFTKEKFDAIIEGKVS